MPSIKAGTLAGALLPHATDSGVVDILLPKSDLTSDVTLQAAPTPAMAKKYVKGKAAKATTVAAQPDTDPAVLSQLAKNPLVSVRQALLRNPSTPYESVLSLTHWAHTRDTTEDMAAGIVRLQPADAIDVLRNRKAGIDHALSYSFHKVAEGIVDTGDKDLVLSAYSLKIANLQDALARNVYERTNPCISLTELVTSDPSASSNRLATLSSSQEHCSLELASLLKEIPSDWKSSYYGGLTPFIMLADGADAELMKAENVNIRRLAMQSGVRGPLLDDTIRRANLMIVVSMVRDVGRQFTKKQEIALLEQVMRFSSEKEQGSPASALLEVLNASSHRLPSKLLLEAFRLIGGPAVGMWLNGSFRSNEPRPGEIKDLVDNPGMAFIRQVPRVYGYANSAYGYGQAQTQSAAKVSSPEDIRAVLVSNMDMAMQRSWADEYAVALGQSLLPNLPRSRHSASWVAKRFYAAFGTHEGCWETMLSLAVDWTEDIESLISATLIINEMEPPVLVEPVKSEQMILDGIS